ncbi:MAG: sigma-70 family RNA polymerase sigma factor [Romboutsia sp.]|uniref:sigma-70 family RNA polymerase sigma factor n=1 Tax=Romboutsia sp. TaxID=1965302 RepID=UPI003F39A931
MDIKIIKKAIKGNFNAYSILVNELKSDGYKMAYTILRNEDDSIDAYLQAVEKGLKNITTLKEPEYFKTWFMRIVINEAKNIMRKNNKVISIQDCSINEESESMNTDVKLDLEKALENVDSTTREMIRLKFYMGYSLEEISNILKVPIGTVKGKMYTALKNMRKDLEVKEYEKRTR